MLIYNNIILYTYMCETKERSRDADISNLCTRIARKCKI